VARVAVYTAIYGGYDLLHPQPSSPDVDYICFTDADDLDAPPNWHIERRAPRYAHPRLSAKWFKMHPDKELPSHRYTIWIDGCMKVASASFAEEAMSALNDSGIAVFRHPDRDNIADEVVASEPLAKYAGLALADQVLHYQRCGFELCHGLYACGVIVRDNASERISDLNRLWMEENVRRSYQDQLSFPYVCWKLGLTPGVIPYNFWDNPLFERLPHLSDL
jgi:hypothetical protein